MVNNPLLQWVNVLTSVPQTTNIFNPLNLKPTLPKQVPAFKNTTISAPAKNVFGNITIPTIAKNVVSKNFSLFWVNPNASITDKARSLYDIGKTYVNNIVWSVDKLWLWDFSTAWQWEVTTMIKWKSVVPKDFSYKNITEATAKNNNTAKNIKDLVIWGAGLAFNLWAPLTALWFTAAEKSPAVEQWMGVLHSAVTDYMKGTLIDKWLAKVWLNEQDRNEIYDLASYWVLFHKLDSWYGRIKQNMPSGKTGIMPVETARNANPEDVTALFGEWYKWPLDFQTIKRRIKEEQVLNHPDVGWDPKKFAEVTSAWNRLLQWDTYATAPLADVKIQQSIIDAMKKQPGMIKWFVWAAKQLWEAYKTKNKWWLTEVWMGINPLKPFYDIRKDRENPPKDINDFEKRLTSTERDRADALAMADSFKMAGAVPTNPEWIVQAQKIAETKGDRNQSLAEQKLKEDILAQMGEDWYDTNSSDTQNTVETKFDELMNASNAAYLEAKKQSTANILSTLPKLTPLEKVTKDLWNIAKLQLKLQDQLNKWRITQEMYVDKLDKLKAEKWSLQRLKDKLQPKSEVGNKLITEAKKYKSAELFLQSVHEISIKDIVDPKIRDKIISKLWKIESRTIDQPAIVEIKDGKIHLLDWTQRYYNKIDRGDTTMKIRFAIDRNQWAIKLWEEANNKPTQTQQVKSLLTKKEAPMSIKQVADETGIVEPNIRRILGQGEKVGEFTRVGKWVYTIETKEGTKAIIHVADALETVKDLVKKGTKVDMVFMDIPYDTPAVKWGNRGRSYDLISVWYFRELMSNISELVKSKETPIYFMFSNAKSGWDKMQQYIKVLEHNWFKHIATGWRQKLFQNGKPVTNVRWAVAEPEGISLYNKDWVFRDKDIRKLDFVLTRPKWLTEKPVEMMTSLIKQWSNIWDIIYDPFAWAGPTVEAALKEWRNIIVSEKSPEQAQKIIERTKWMTTEAIVNQAENIKQLAPEEKKAYIEKKIEEFKKKLQPNLIDMGWIPEQLFPDMPKDKIKLNKDVFMPKDTYDTPQQAIIEIEKYRAMFKTIRDFMKANNIEVESKGKAIRFFQRLTHANLLGKMWPNGKSVVGNIINTKLKKINDMAITEWGKMMSIKNKYFGRTWWRKDAKTYIPKEQREALTDYIEQGIIPSEYNGIAPANWEAYRQERFEKITKPIADMTTMVGIKDIEPNIKYVTHFLKKEFLDKFRSMKKQEMLDYMLEQWLEWEAADQIYNAIKAKDEKHKLFWPLELPRNIEIIPREWIETDISKVDDLYIQGSMSRIMDAREFWPKDEILNYLLQQAVAIWEWGRPTGYDAWVFPKDMKDLTDEYRWLKDKSEFAKAMTAFADNFTGFTSTILLRLQPLQNWWDLPIKSIPRYWLRDTWLWILRYFTNKGKKLTKEMWVNPKVVEGNMKEQWFSTNKVWVFVYEPVEFSVRWWQQLAAIEAVTRDFAYLKKVQWKKQLWFWRNETAKSRKRLQEHFPNENIDILLEQDKLTQDQERMIGVEAVRQTQPINIPIWMRHWIGKIFTQFRSYPYIHQKFLWEFVLKPAFSKTAWNPMPLIKYMVVAPLIWEAVLDLMALAKGKTRTKNIPKRLAEDYLQAWLWLYYQILNTVISSTEYWWASKFALALSWPAISNTLTFIFNIIHDVKASLKWNVAWIWQKSAPGRSQLLAVKQLIKILWPWWAMLSEIMFPSKNDKYWSNTLTDMIFWWESKWNMKIPSINMPSIKIPSFKRSSKPTEAQKKLRDSL